MLTITCYLGTATIIIVSNKAGEVVITIKPP
jgi:hypothetical protein